MLGRFLVFLGGLLVVLLFAALLAPMFITWTDFRKDFEEQASRILGKKVTVHGDVDARLLPFPSVTLHDVRVGTDADGSPLVQVARFSMDAELAPFLSGEARIFNMRLEEPTARIRLLKDGKLDWMRGSRADIPARNVVLENVQITDGTIDFIDEQSGRTRHVTALNSEMSATSLAGPWRADGTAVIDGEAVTLGLSSSQPDPATGTVRLRSRILPKAQPVSVDLDGELKVADGKPNYAGSFSSAFLPGNDKKDRDYVPGPRASGKFELTNERIRLSEYRMELGATDNPYIITGEATLDTGNKPEFLLIADGQQIDVNRIGNEGASGKTGRNAAASGRQRLNALIAMAADIPIPQVPGRASLKLPAIVAGDTTLRDIRMELRPNGSGWTVDNAVATLPGRTQVEAKGGLVLRGQPSFAGSLLLASSQPSGLASWLAGEVDPSIRKLKAAGFSATVNLTPELQRFEGLEVAIGPATLKGRVERHSTGGGLPDLTVDLSGNEIDLDAIRALAGLLTGDEAGQGLLDHRIAAHLKADRFTAFGIGATSVDTAFTLSAGSLALDRLTIGDLAGAALTANGKAEGSLLSYTGTGAVTFSAFDPGPFFDMLRANLPAHPLLDRLAQSAVWYADSQLTAAITLGGQDGEGLGIKLAGTANGSSIDASLAMSDIMALERSDSIKVDVTLENPVTSVLFGQAGLQPLPFEADENGKLSVSLRAEGTAPADTQINFTTSNSNFSVAGKFSLQPGDFGQGQAQLSLKSGDIEPFLFMNGISLPQIGGGLPVELGSGLTVDADKAQLSGLSGQVAGNVVSGDLSIGRGTPSLKADGHLELSTIDLQWLAEAIYGPVTDPLEGKLSTAALGAPFFGGSDINLVVKAKNFWPGVFGAVGDFSGKLQYKAGGITLDDIAGNWNGGTLAGRVLMANGDNAGIFQTRLNVSNADLGTVVWNNGGAPVASGRFDLAVSAETTGKSIADMASAVGGSGELKVAGLTIAKLNAGLLQPLLVASDKLDGEITATKVSPLVEGLVGTGAMALGNVAIPFNISDGEIRLQNVTAANPQAHLSGEARLHIADETMDARLSVGFAPGEEAMAGADPALRLSYAGALSAPKRSLDVADMTNFLSLRAFERERRRVETLQASVLEKQRLRREVSLYKSLAIERQSAADEKARQEEAARLKAIADAAAQKAADEAAAAKAAADKAAEEKRQRALPVLPAAPQMEDIIRGNPVPGAPTFPNLPGVQ